jgi:hypothetical protein
VLLSACGEKADLRTDRPDVTMAPPPSGDDATPVAKENPVKAKHHHKKKKAPTARLARWQRVTDKSGISFLLPSAVDPTVTALPAAGAQQRVYVSAPGDGSTVLVIVDDIPGTTTFDVDGGIAGATAQLRALGATSVSVGNRRSLTVAGHRAAEFDLTFAQGAAQGYAIYRIVMLSGRFVLAGVASPATGVLAQARRDSQRLQARLNDGLRLG